MSETNKSERWAKDGSVIETLVEALEVALQHCEQLMRNAKDCGDPHAECPLQDCQKDYSTAGVVAQLTAAIAIGKAAL